LARIGVIVLDTHVWLWYFDRPETLSRKAAAAIAAAVAEGKLLISSISSWELHLLVKKGRLNLGMTPREWIQRSDKLPFVQFAPVDNAVVEDAVNLPGKFHPDPADRFIVATARLRGVPVVTKDDKIRRYKHVTTIW
jgi:PIN domain nuclease of toxin-antitoxin system